MRNLLAIPLALLTMAAVATTGEPEPKPRPPPVRAERVSPFQPPAAERQPPAAALPEAGPEPEPPAGEYTRVEVKGVLTFDPQKKEYGVNSQGRLWALDLGRDRMMLFLAPALKGKPVVVKGLLVVTEGKLDRVVPHRIEPVELPSEK